MLKSIAYFLFSRADAARQALDKAREEEYNKRVGLCGVRSNLIWPMMEMRFCLR